MVIEKMTHPSLIVRDKSLEYIAAEKLYLSVDEGYAGLISFEEIKEPRKVLTYIKRFGKRGDVFKKFKYKTEIVGYRFFCVEAEVNQYKEVNGE